MKLDLRLIVSLIALSAVCACATDEPAPAPEHHHRHHGEGRPDGDQAPGPVAERGGGLFISPMGAPYRAGPQDPYPSAAWFQAVNITHDGHLTRKEFHADAEAFFRQLDANHDGVIDAAEISAYERAVPEIVAGFRPAAAGAQGASGRGAGGEGRHGGGRHGGSGGSGGRGGGGGSSGRSQAAAQAADTKPQGAAWFSFLSIPEPVASADRNLNGRITLDEFLAAADARFDELDADQAGYLSFDKLPKTPVQLLKRAPAGD